MGKRKRGGDEKTPLLRDAMACPLLEEDSVSKENLRRVLSLRHPCRYGHVDSRKKSTKKSSVSTSPSNVTKQDKKLSNTKVDCQNNLCSGLDKDKVEDAFGGTKRSKTSTLPAKLIPFLPTKGVCGLCGKLIDVYTIAAVLVCGHVYHAEECFERTCVENQSDPSCPLCF